MRSGAIPFAYRRGSTALVDVADVAQGRACDCQCPSCGRPVLARKGEIREWHFAHDTAADDGGNARSCEFSWFVATRLASHVVLQNLRSMFLPALEVEGGLRPPHQLHFDVADVSTSYEGTAVDATFSLGRWTLVLYIDHPGRAVPDVFANVDSKTVAILSLNLEALRSDLTADRGEYLERLTHLLRDTTKGKRWLRHPRMRSRRIPLRADVPQIPTAPHRRSCGMCGHKWLAPMLQHACPSCKAPPICTVAITPWYLR
jgi:hypothetical protein